MKKMLKIAAHWPKETGEREIPAISHQEASAMHTRSGVRPVGRSPSISGVGRP